HDVAALGTGRDLYGIGEHFDAGQHAVACVRGKFYVRSSHVALLLKTARVGCGARHVLERSPLMSASFMLRRSAPSLLTSVPDHLPNSTRSPTLTSSGVSLPLSSRPPGPTASTSPSEGFSAAVSGMMMPPAVFWSAVTRFTTTRSWRGRKRLDMSFLCAG